MINVDEEMKERLRNNYERNIQLRREKFLKEKEERLNEEKERNRKIEEISKKEKEDILNNKRYITKMQYDDLKRVQELNRVKSMKLYEEKMIPQNVSLDIESQNNAYKIRHYIFSQSDRIDNNIDNYYKFQQYYQNAPTKNQKQTKQAEYISPMVGRQKYINDMYSIKRGCTDVTDRFINDKFDNPEYFDYVQKNKEYKDYNKNMSIEKGRSKEMMYINSVKDEINEYNQKTNYGNREKENKLQNEQRKKDYKELLDEQRKSTVISKLKNENFTVQDININPQYYKGIETDIDQNTKQYNTLNVPGKTFLNRNYFVEVNPYCKKQYNLGNTFLPHNPILNPVINYKYNRYMFPQNNEFRGYSPFQNVGNSIAN